jgi:hypothetical protein
MLTILRFNGIIIIENYLLRYLATIIISAIFLVLALDSFSLKIFPLKVLFSISFGLLFLGSCIVVLFTTMGATSNFESKEDQSFECIKIISYENRRFKAYRTDMGAMGGYGIVVREERTIFPGLIKVKEIASTYSIDTIGLNIFRDSLIITDLESNKKIKVVSLH